MPALEDVLARPLAMRLVCHRRDSEEAFVTRVQITLAMLEPKVFPTDPDRWARERQYLRNDTAEAQEAFRLRRQESDDHDDNHLVQLGVGGPREPTAVLVNVARAEIVDEAALHQAPVERTAQGEPPLNAIPRLGSPAGQVGA